MRNLFHRIPKPYLGFIALFFLVGATACEQLVQDSAREAAVAGREIRNLEDTELRPLYDRMQALQFDEIQPRQQEIDDLRREIDRIQRQVIEPLWNQVNDPWATGGELYVAQEALQGQYDLIDSEYRLIELESRELERRFRDAEQNFGGFDPAIRQMEDRRYDLQRELDRLYRFGQEPIDEVWNQVNSINSNPGGTFDSSQFEIEQLNNKIAGLYDQANWLQADLDNRIREKEDLRADVEGELNNHTWYGRSEIDSIYAEIGRLEAELGNATVVTVSEGTGFSEEIDALRAERDVLINLLNADLAQVDSDIATRTAERDDAVATYQASIDASNLEISLLSAPSTSDTTASSTPETTTNNDDEIAVLQAEVVQLEADRDAIVAPLDDILNALQATRDSLTAERQPTIDDVDARILDLQSAEVETVTTTVIPEGLTEELDFLRNKVVGLEDVYTAELDKLQGLLSSILSELDVLYNTGNAPVEQIYRDIDVLNGQINDLNVASEQNQLQQNDAVNALAAQAELLQQQLNADIGYLEGQLFNIDDELQGLYRNGEDDRYDDQIAFNEAQRELEDRRYTLDDRRWLLDQQQQDLYSQNNDPYKDIQVKADLLYTSEIQPLMNRINQLEEELMRLRNEERSLQKEIRLAEQGLRDRERVLEDKAFDFLDTIAGDPATDGSLEVEGLVDEAINEVIDPVGEALTDEVIDPITDELLDAAGELIDEVGGLDPATITDEPVLDPEPVVEPVTTDDPVNADGTVVDTTDAPVDSEPVDGTDATEPLVEPVQ